MKSKSFASFTKILNYLIKYFKLVVFAAMVLGVLTGVYRVESNEVAVVLRFGRLVGNVASEQVKLPGIHYALPFFIDEVIKVPVQTVHEKEILTHFTTGNEGGFSSSSAPPTASVNTDALLDLSNTFDDGSLDADKAQNVNVSAVTTPSAKSTGYLITGDKNVVNIKVMVKYRIDNAVQYALYSCDTGSAIDGVISSELTSLVTHMHMDSVLTTGKAQLAAEITRNSQEVLDHIKAGVVIANLELTEIVPPAQTKRAFENVISASVDKEVLIQQARQSASTLVLKAEAEAKNYTQVAISKQSERLTRAHNEMSEFNGLFNEYTKDPQIVINGTFRKRVGEVLKKMGSSIIVPDGDSAPTVILP